MQIKKIIPYLLLTAILSLPLNSHSQPPAGGDDPAAPFDGGLSLLIAAGAAYGAKRYRNHKKKQSEDAGQDLK